MRAASKEIGEKGRAVDLIAGEGHLSRTVIEHLVTGAVRRHSLSIVSLDAGGQITITPFRGERPATLYHDRPLHLWRATALLYEQA